MINFLDLVQEISGDKNESTIITKLTDVDLREIKRELYEEWNLNENAYEFNWLLTRFIEYTTNIQCLYSLQKKSYEYYIVNTWQVPTNYLLRSILKVDGYC